eukprot:TRINITY_DN21386_c0_g1_i1.p1 TRINITY_DN21386_c0_g1~~TRINITY_DN21386_c0_g1_i1.p1  ORF type:complete len:216 (+),score=5.73 TRINITY_DN21386_c0_g1_i1:2-649(+)
MACALRYLKFAQYASISKIRITPIHFRCYANNVIASKHERNAAQAQTGTLTVYKNRVMRRVRFASRLKLAHVAFMGLAVPNLLHAHSIAAISDEATILASCGLLGSGGILIALTRFTQRIIGQLAVDTDSQQLIVSTLTFWGSRQDYRLPLQALTPVFDRLDDHSKAVLASQSFIPVPLRPAFQDNSLASRSPLLLSLKYGSVLHSNVFESIMGR